MIIVMALPKINLRIIPNVQAQIHAFNARIAANHRVIQHRVLQAREIADNAVFYNRITDMHIVADGHIGPDDAVVNLAIGADCYRVDKNSVFCFRQMKFIGGVPALTEQHGIGFQQHIFSAAIEPVAD